MSQLIKIPGPGDLLAERYRILGELGRGAYGVVFHAMREDDGVEVAIKTLLPQSVLDHEVVNRFTREAQLIAHLNHPSIITLYDYGEREGLFYMAMEYVAGRSLAEVLEQDAPMSPSQAGDICGQILRALEHAHGEGIVHRDLKPDNILLQEVSWGEQVKVLDFGIAKMVSSDQEFQTLTAAGNVLGTPHYMSPEQISGDDVSHHADLYSVGVILYQLLTGARPFDAPNATAVMVRHLRDDAPPLPGPLESSKWGEAVRAALVKQPFDRIESATKMLEIIERDEDAILDDLDVTTVSSSETPWGGFTPGDGLDSDATTQFVAADLRSELQDNDPTAHWDTNHLMVGSARPPVESLELSEPLELAEPMRMRASIPPLAEPAQRQRDERSAILPLLIGVLLMALLCVVLVMVMLGEEMDPETPAAHAAHTARVEDAPGERPSDPVIPGDDLNEATDEVDPKPDPKVEPDDASSKLDPSGAKATRTKDPVDDAKKPRKKRDPKTSAGGDDTKVAVKKSDPQKATVKLTVRSEPSGALVLVNGRTQTTKTPLDIEVKKGARVKLELRYKGYKNHRQTVSMSKDRSVTLTLKPGVVF